MKRFLSLLILPLALAACAPAQTVTTTAPSPPAEAPATPAPTPAEPSSPVEPADALVVAPDNWWLLDRDADQVFGTSAERAYAELLPERRPARTVVVAIVDSGVDYAHEDLDDNIWTNDDEIAGNGVDDDDNGYVDDIHGWSFLGNPAGENVHHDTYEVTRLYVQCMEEDQLDTPTCESIEAELEAERAETSELLEQYRTMEFAFERFTAMLEAHLGTDSLTPAAVAGIQTTRPDIRQAQQVYLQLVEAGVTAEDLTEGVEALSSRLEYGLNPEFDPRPIVGDDYDDPNERFYGNDDIEGPAADHGTHVAGIVGAERDNDLGVDGIASAVELMVIRAVPDGDERDKDIANAIRYAVDNGADIINMSFGKGYSPYKAVVDEAVRYAEAAGVLIVHAAGNDAANLDTENNFPNRYYADGGQAELWIEVGASNWRGIDQLAAPFSNYSAAEVDVFAPGVAILSTAPGDDYDRSQGTSMAAPVVSGLAALLMAYYPQLSAGQVKDIILDTATRFPDQIVSLPGDPASRRPFAELSVTGGIVNAYAALERAATLAAQARR